MLRPGVCARCQSTWVPDSKAAFGPVYCPLCELETSPGKDRVSSFCRRLVQKAVRWPFMPGIPLLILALVCLVTVSKTVLARRASPKSPGNASTALTNAPIRISAIEPPSTLAAIAPAQGNANKIVIIAPPREVAVLTALPCETSARAEAAAVAKQALAPQPAVAKENAPKVCETPAGMFGTSLLFAASPTEASKQAAAQEKLVFLLHVSGDFDDPGFT